MPFLIPAGVAAAAGIAGYAQTRKARKAAEVEAIAQTSDIQREASITEANLFEQARAADTQRHLIADRLLLQTRQEAEAEREARMPGVDFTLGEKSLGQDEAAKRRKQFFDFTLG